ncbi:MAG: AAA family ATPase [Solirubrobacteraceae bacterium]
MRDDELRERLLDNNPWWRAAATGQDPTSWVNADQTLRARRPYDLGYRSDLLDDVGAGLIDDKLVVVYGPRRVGKSVLVKDTAARLCARRDVDPRQLVYIPTDGMRAADLRRVAKVGRELTRSVKDAPRVWLLDEVTGVRDWTQAIKYLRDNTPFGTDTVVCTGSSWDPGVEVERDLLAGRAGSTSRRRSRILHPMSFRDVLLVTGRTIPAPARSHPWELQSHAARTAAESLEFFLDELDLAWQSYLTSGGFPRAVAEHHRQGGVSEAFLRDLAAWLHRDVDPTASEDSVPRLLSEIELRATSPLNRRTIAETLGYTSRQTADLRLTRLVRTLAAIWCHQIDEDGRRIAGAQSKLYLCDPVLAWLGPQLRTGLPRPDFTRLTEACTGLALARAVDQLEPGRWQSDDSIGYLRTGGGNEIDLGPVPVPTPSGPRTTTPIESKWVSQGWRAEARTIEGKLCGGLVATRSILDCSNPSWAVPAPIVSLLLG